MKPPLAIAPIKTLQQVPAGLKSADVNRAHLLALLRTTGHAWGLRDATAMAWRSCLSVSPVASSTTESPAP